MIIRNIVAALTFVSLAGLTGCASRGGDASSSTASPPAQSTQPAAAPTKPEAQKAATPYTGKVLVLGSALPPGVDHEVLGPVTVFMRSYGGIGDSYRLLGDKGREVGANAIIDARVWLAPAFPIAAAPHGAGTAVRVRSQARLDEISKTGGRWE